MDCRIERIEIVSFGKLKNIVLEPGPGLQLLVAPNESGKSTLAAFLRFVLYGYADSRKKELFENDKKKYTPWDTPRSEGSLLLRVGETCYRITRSYVSGGKESVRTVEHTTGKEVFAGKVPGVELLGVSEEVFSRTLFYRQLTLPQGKDEVLAEQLQNLAVSANGQVGSKQATERLTKAKNELRGRGASGWIPHLEQESARLSGQLDAARREREEMDEMRLQSEKLQTTLRENAASRARIAEEKKNLRNWEAARQLARIRKTKQTMEQSEEAYRAMELGMGENGFVREQTYAELRAEYAGWEAARARAKRASEALEAEALPQNETKKSPALAIGACLLLLCGLCLLGYAIWSAWVWGYAAGAGGVLLAVLLFVLHRKQTHPRQTNGERLGALRAVLEQETQTEQTLRTQLEAHLQQVGMTLTDRLSEELQERIDACIELTRMRDAAANAAEAYRLASEGVDMTQPEQCAANATEPSRTREVIEREEVFLQQQWQMLSARASETEVRLARMEGACADPAVLAGKRDAVGRMLEECRKRYDAYELARACIEEASDRMKASVAPRLGSIAGAYLSAATDGKYREMRLDTQLAMSVREDGPERESDYLSAGTRDCAYLALRLALTELLFNGAGMPFVLDDAFGRLDDDRLRGILRVLAEASGKQQILLLCCTDREKQILQSEQIPFGTLTLT